MICSCKRTPGLGGPLEKARVLIYLGRAPEALELLNRLRQEQPRNRAAAAAAVEAYLHRQGFCQGPATGRQGIGAAARPVLGRAGPGGPLLLPFPGPKHLRHTCDLLLENLRHNRHHHPSLLILAALLPRLPRYEDLDYVMNRLPGTQGGGHGPAAALAYFDGQLGRQGGKLNYLLHVLQGYRRQRRPDSPGELLGLAWLATEMGTARPRCNTTARPRSSGPTTPKSPNCCCNASCPGRIGARPWKTWRTRRIIPPRPWRWPAST